jgi:hypothetical protein
MDGGSGSNAGLLSAGSEFDLTRDWTPTPYLGRPDDSASHHTCENDAQVVVEQAKLRLRGLVRAEPDPRVQPKIGQFTKRVTFGEPASLTYCHAIR